MYTWDFPDIKFRVAAQLAGSMDKAAKFRGLYDIGERNPFQRPRYDLDRAQKLISSSMSQQMKCCVSTDVDTLHFIQIHARVFE